MTSTPRTWARLAAALVMFVALLPLGSNALAAESGNTRPLYFPEGDVVYNYDFNKTSGASWQTVDWGVTLLFWNNASVNRVKDASAVDRYFAFGGPQYGYQNDGSGGAYDSDRGIKTDTPSCFGDTRHFRIYADSDDRLYNTNYGYYVYATTHKDFNELCADYYGDANGTESDVANRFSSAGYQVDRNYAYFYNYEPAHVDRLDSKHRWDSDGYATYIRM